MQTAVQKKPSNGITSDLVLVPGVLEIGRAGQNHICLDSPSISHYHAKIVTYFHESYLIDLSSEEGTFLNGKRVIKHSLKPGDIIQLGEYSFKVRSPSEWYFTDPARPATDRASR